MQIVDRVGHLHEIRSAFEHDVPSGWMFGLYRRKPKAAGKPADIKKRIRSRTKKASPRLAEIKGLKK